MCINLISQVLLKKNVIFQPHKIIRIFEVSILHVCNSSPFPLQTAIASKYPNKQEVQNYRVSKNVLYRVSENYQKYQINNEPNYDSCNRIFDMWSYYCENFIYISLSIAMWHGIFENWRITKMPFQRKRSILKTLHKQTGALNSSFSREKAH